MQSNSGSPYRLRQPFLTAPETALYKSLVSMSKGRYVVLAKIALGDLVRIVRPNENVHYFGRLFRKSLDFLLCDSATMRPELAVQISGPPRESGARPFEAFLAQLFESVGLPLAQVPPSAQYQAEDLIAALRVAITRSKQRAESSNAATDSLPVCPTCGKLMVLRRRQGRGRVPELYYGCVDNPTCPGEMEIGVGGQ